MEVYTPIEFLKNKLAELKTISGVEPNLIIEYEKAILVLELIGSTAFDDKIKEPYIKNNFGSNHDEPKKEPKSYFEKFMEAQKNKNSKPK
jgi:hypothetical protein